LTYNPSTGALSSVDYNSTSDKKLKTNIKSIENSIDILRKINPISFEWKETGKKSYGLIAQELEKILPELVSENEISKTKSVSYIPLISILIDTVKQQQLQIESILKALDSGHET